MFDTIKMMAKARELQDRMKALQDELAARQISATSPGDEVTAIVSGRMELLRVRIDPSKLANPADFEAIERFTVIAVATAQQRMAELIKTEMSKLASEMGLPAGMLPGA